MVRPKNPNLPKRTKYFTTFYTDELNSIKSMAKQLNMPVNRLMATSAKVYGKKLVERARKDGLC